MNILYYLGIGLFSILFSESNRSIDLRGRAYTCTALQWPTPLEKGADDHLRGVAQVQCQFPALSGGGFSQLETHLLDQIKVKATQINSGPTAVSLEALPGEAFDFNVGLPFGDTTVDAHEIGTIVSDKKTRLVSLMKTLEVTGTDYDSYLHGFDLKLDVKPLHKSKPTEPKQYTVKLSLSVDVTKPWIVSMGLFKSKVTQSVEHSIDQYREPTILELENNI